MPEITFLDRTGDTTIEWDSADDAEFEAFIAKKMQEGVTFFILPPRKSNRGAAPKRKPLKDAADAKTYRKVEIGDDDLGKLIASGKARVIRRDPAPLKDVPVKRATIPAEVVKGGRAIATRPRVGG